MLNSHENCYAGTNSCFLWNKIIWRQRPTLLFGIRATGKNSPRITFRPNIHNSPSLTVQPHPQTLTSSRRRALSSPPVRKKEPTRPHGCGALAAAGLARSHAALSGRRRRLAGAAPPSPAAAAARQDLLRITAAYVWSRPWGTARGRERPRPREPMGLSPR